MLLILVIFFSQFFFSFGAIPTNLYIVDIYPAPFLNGKPINVQALINTTTATANFTGGIITLYIDNETSQNQTIAAGPEPNSGIVFFRRYYLEGGSYSFQLAYWGDSNYESSNSSVEVIDVGPALTNLSLEDIWWAQINTPFDVTAYLTFPGITTYPLGAGNTTYLAIFSQQQYPKATFTFLQNSSYWWKNGGGFNLILGPFLIPYTGPFQLNLTLFGNENYEDCFTSELFTMDTTDIDGIDVEALGPLIAGENVSLQVTIQAGSQIPLSGEVLFFYPSDEIVPFCAAEVIPNKTVNGSGTAVSIPYPFQYNSSYANNYNNYLRLTFMGLNYTTTNYDEVLNVRPVTSFLEFDTSRMSDAIISNLWIKIHLSADTAGIITGSSYLVVYVNGKIVMANATVTQRCPFGQIPCYDGEAPGDDGFTFLNYGVNELMAVYVSEDITFNQSIMLDTCLNLSPCVSCSQHAECSWCGNLTSIGSCSSLASSKNNTNASCQSNIYVLTCPTDEPKHGGMQRDLLIVIIVLPVFFGALLLAGIGYLIYKKYFSSGDHYTRNSI